MSLYQYGSSYASAFESRHGFVPSFDGFEEGIYAVEDVFFEGEDVKGVIEVNDKNIAFFKKHDENGNEIEVIKLNYNQEQQFEDALHKYGAVLYG